MKQTLILIWILTAFVICCEKNDDSNERSTFLIVGDSINCRYLNFNPDKLLRSYFDSLDIDFDYKYDIEFFRNIVIIDSCEGFLENCPPDMRLLSYHFSSRS